MRSIKSTCHFKTFNFNDLTCVITQAGRNIIHTVRAPAVLANEESKGTGILWKRGNEPRKTIGLAPYGSSPESP